MFRAGLLVIIRRYFYVLFYVGWLLAGSGWILIAASQHKHMTYTICCIYRLVPLDDEHVEINY